MNQRLVLTAALLAACVALAGCGASSAPSIRPSPTALARFDLSGTAWLAMSVSGQAVPAENAPRVEFDWLGRRDGRGYTGCQEFGFSATIAGDKMTVGDVTPPPKACNGAKGQLEERFLTAFQAIHAWSVEGDRLTLAGIPGQIVFARELPPRGDPSRQLADALTEGEWRVVRAPGVAGIDRLPAVLFADTLLIAAGECGFVGNLRFGSGGALDITEVGWDVGGCSGGPDDGRLALKALLEAVTMGRLDADGTIVLTGPDGDVVLGR